MNEKQMWSIISEKKKAKSKIEFTINIGFTGTQKGMTRKQFQILDMLSEAFSSIKETLIIFHHGDCIGADFEAGELFYHKKCKVYIHPPEDSKKRAFSKKMHVIFDRKPYLKRNHNIVNMSNIMIACPNTTEEELRSGTWATIRYARKQNKRIIIIEP